MTSARQVLVARILAGKTVGDKAREIVDDRGRVLFVSDLNSALVLCGYGPAPLDPLPISLPDLLFLWPEPGH